MIKRPAIVTERLHALRDWMFHPRKSGGSPWPGLAAIFITAAAFALFAATIQIRIRTPKQWVERKASILHLPSQGEGKSWALRAQEGGPFPSRVDTAAWENPAAMIAATRFSPAPYEPILRDLPAEAPIAALELASRSERVFPGRAAKTEPTPAPVIMRLAPALYPLSGIPREAIPENLPAFDGLVDAAMSSASLRFLLRLRPDGSVSECVSLTDDPGGNAMVNWLRGVAFPAAVATKSEWIGIGVGFTNQAIHGPDAR